MHSIYKQISVPFACPMKKSVITYWAQDKYILVWLVHNQKFKTQFKVEYHANENSLKILKK